MVENKVLECEKKKAETELEDLKAEFKVLECEKKRAETELVDMKAEFKVLESEKKSAEMTVEVWKEKFEKLESKVYFKDTPHSFTPVIKDKEHDVRSEPVLKHGKRARRQLSFEEEQSPQGKIAPAMPGCSKPLNGVIDICDSDDELGANDMDICKENLNSSSPQKRKRASKIVTSDDDDEVSIRDMEMMCNNDEAPVKPKRRRLRTLRECEEQATLKQNRSSKLKNSETKDHVETHLMSGAKDCESESSGEFNVRGSDISESDNVTGTLTKDHISSTNVVEEDSESEIESESESEDESSDSFIVSDSKVSETESSNNTASSVSADESDDNVNVIEIISTIQRNKKLETWEFEADMLAAFGKDPELCMKAVCALYRQQTSDEQLSMETVHNNGRGFSMFDANRGSALARFITAGDPSGDVKRSVEELMAYDSKAVEVCRDLAARYSKQLFQIYKNKEDPLFLPR